MVEEGGGGKRGAAGSNAVYAASTAFRRVHDARHGRVCSGVQYENTPIAPPGSMFCRPRSSYSLCQKLREKTFRAHRLGETPPRTLAGASPSSTSKAAVEGGYRNIRCRVWVPCLAHKPTSIYEVLLVGAVVEHNSTAVHIASRKIHKGLKLVGTTEN